MRESRVYSSIAFRLVLSMVLQAQRKNLSSSNVLPCLPLKITPAKSRAAASLLVKGGTLVSEPCQKCSGVQVRFGDKTTCINCGNMENSGSAQNKVGPDKAQVVFGPGQLISAASLIEEKIALACKRNKARERRFDANAEGQSSRDLSPDLRKDKEPNHITSGIYLRVGR